MIAALLLAAAADPRAAALATFASAQKTVVGVRIVAKLTMGGHDREEKEETVGTVVDPSGLTVVPSVAADPGELMQALLRGRPEMHFEASVTSTTLIMPDGTEVDADVILKDTDLDLAFVRPRTPLAKPVDAVQVKAGRALPALLDELIVVGRYGRAQNRAPWVATAQVQAIVKGPRPYAMCGEASHSAAGTVAYSVDGAPAGILTAHVGKELEPSQMRMLSAGAGGLAVVLRSMDDLAGALEQARKAPSPAPTAAAK
ncbi:MAG TPA: hypothetical protein VLW85_14830 [Myxococcales bacterium]|nr:hypothetical protein [Myxococcales bacterium]